MRREARGFLTSDLVGEVGGEILRRLNALAHRDRHGGQGLGELAEFIVAVATGERRRRGLAAGAELLGETGQAADRGDETGEHDGADKKAGEESGKADDGDIVELGEHEVVNARGVLNEDEDDIRVGAGEDGGWQRRR